MATSVADNPADTLDGAVNCNVKWLVIVMFPEACFVESATLVATTFNVAEDGRICGAV